MDWIASGGRSGRGSMIEVPSSALVLTCAVFEAVDEAPFESPPWEGGVVARDEAGVRSEDEPLLPEPLSVCDEREPERHEEDESDEE